MVFDVDIDADLAVHSERNVAMHTNIYIDVDVDTCIDSTRARPSTLQTQRSLQTLLSNASVRSW